ncbi:hypothetical protein CXG81DRAFT_26604 [Caulochytrium protostelioides]|uniref:Uncharacterized protein n=1 Tax=Caulochytrium protostelioides TaxID=1555241 RepID=A0A4V1IUI7_9FUNG|nr:hypothetical protein CXG81DRAFT_26604 [Caulochytrium protostelioides]|eukprot:RKP00699.1 hypothetical protein CXG81DRAFT_26604 [Caulochytrium protostelioides]
MLHTGTGTGTGTDANADGGATSGWQSADDDAGDAVRLAAGRRLHARVLPVPASAIADTELDAAGPGGGGASAAADHAARLGRLARSESTERLLQRHAHEIEEGLGGARRLTDDRAYDPTLPYDAATALNDASCSDDEDDPGDDDNDAAAASTAAAVDEDPDGRHDPAAASAGERGTRPPSGSAGGHRAAAFRRMVNPPLQPWAALQQLLTAQHQPHASRNAGGRAMQGHVALPYGFHLCRQMPLPKPQLRKVLHLANGQIATLEGNRVTRWRSGIRSHTRDLGGNPRNRQGVTCWCYARKWGLIIVGTLRMDIKCYSGALEECGEFAHPSPVLCVYFREDSDDLIVGTVGGVRIYHVEKQIRRSKMTFSISQPPIVLDNDLDVWVSSLAMVHDPLVLIAAGDTSVLSYSLHSHREIARITNIHDLSITAILWIPVLNALVTGSRDTTIKIWNSQLNLLYLLSGHVAPITGLASFGPAYAKPWFVSCSSDSTLRIWNADLGQCIYRMGLPQPCVDIQIDQAAPHAGTSVGGGVSSPVILTACPSLVQSWQFDRSFTIFNYTVNPSIFLMPAGSGALCALAHDGSFRLIGAQTGATLAVSLPGLTDDEVVDTGVAISAGLIYMLLRHGRVNVVSKHSNPCKLVYSWVPRIDGRVCCLVRFIPAEADDALYFIAGMSDGQVGFLNGKTGEPLGLMQVHAAAVVAMAINGHGNRLYTSAQDERTIKVWTVHNNGPPRRSSDTPLLTHVGTIDLQTIELARYHGSVTRMVWDDGLGQLGIMEDGGQLLLTGPKNTLMTPAKDEAHLKPITGIACMAGLGIWVSSSLDGLVKVWASENVALQREIHFGEPIHAITFLNDRGDIAVALEGLVAVVRVEDYMPTQYVAKLIKLPVTDEPEPLPTTFNKELDFWGEFHPADLPRANREHVPVAPAPMAEASDRDAERQRQFEQMLQYIEQIRSQRVQMNIALHPPVPLSAGSRPAGSGRSQSGRASNATLFGRMSGHMGKPLKYGEAWNASFLTDDDDDDDALAAMHPHHTPRDDDVKYGGIENLVENQHSTALQKLESLAWIKANKKGAVKPDPLIVFDESRRPNSALVRTGSGTRLTEDEIIRRQLAETEHHKQRERGRRRELLQQRIARLRASDKASDATKALPLPPHPRDPGSGPGSGPRGRHGNHHDDDDDDALEPTEESDQRVTILGARPAGGRAPTSSTGAAPRATGLLHGARSTASLHALVDVDSEDDLLVMTQHNARVKALNAPRVAHFVSRAPVKAPDDPAGAAGRASVIVGSRRRAVPDGTAGRPDGSEGRSDAAEADDLDGDRADDQPLRPTSDAAFEPSPTLLNDRRRQGKPSRGSKSTYKRSPRRAPRMRHDDDDDSGDNVDGSDSGADDDDDAKHSSRDAQSTRGKPGQRSADAASTRSKRRAKPGDPPASSRKSKKETAATQAEIESIAVAARDAQKAKREQDAARDRADRAQKRYHARLLAKGQTPGDTAIADGYAPATSYEDDGTIAARGNGLLPGMQAPRPPTMGAAPHPGSSLPAPLSPFWKQEARYVHHLRRQPPVRAAPSPPKRSDALAMVGGPTALGATVRLPFVDGHGGHMGPFAAPDAPALLDTAATVPEWSAAVDQSVHLARVPLSVQERMAWSLIEQLAAPGAKTRLALASDDPHDAANGTKIVWQEFRSEFPTVCPNFWVPRPTESMVTLRNIMNTLFQALHGAHSDEAVAACNMLLYFYRVFRDDLGCSVEDIILPQLPFLEHGSPALRRQICENLIGYGYYSNEIIYALIMCLFDADASVRAAAARAVAAVGISTTSALAHAMERLHIAPFKPGHSGIHHFPLGASEALDRMALAHRLALDDERDGLRQRVVAWLPDLETVAAIATPEVVPPVRPSSAMARLEAHRLAAAATAAANASAGAGVSANISANTNGNVQWPPSKAPLASHPGMIVKLGAAKWPTPARTPAMQPQHAQQRPNMRADMQLIRTGMLRSHAQRRVLVPIRVIARAPEVPERTLESPFIE